MIGSILHVFCEITETARIYDQNLQCKLANEDDLQSKSVVKENVLIEFFFYMRNAKPMLRVTGTLAVHVMHSD